MAILNLTAFASIKGTGFFVAALVVAIVVVLASYVVLWFFWRGRKVTQQKVSEIKNGQFKVMVRSHKGNPLIAPALSTHGIYSLSTALNF